MVPDEVNPTPPPSEPPAPIEAAAAASAPAPEAATPQAGAVAPASDDESFIKKELGIGGSKIEIDSAGIEKLLNDAVVGYEQIFAGTMLEEGTTAASVAASSNAPASNSGGSQLVAQNLHLLRDVNMKVKVELGRGRMYLKEILRLAQGSVVELERLAGDPLDIYVNDMVIARGEVLVLNENFCIRITEICQPAEVLRAAM